MSLHLHSSNRRPSSLKPADYDHEIGLTDHTKAQENRRPPSSPSTSEQRLSTELSASSSRQQSDVALRKHHTPQVLREEIVRRKYGKFQDRRRSKRFTASSVREVNQEEDATDLIEDEARGRERPKKQDLESAIDILYENQRGGFLCGHPLFSSSALGALDPAPWTNSANKTSGTGITDTQCPDPSWTWAWDKWSVNHTDEVDEDGWEYSFMFSKKFAWHGATWYSCVRRRAWIRMRVKRHTGYKVEQAHMLTPDYFTIHQASDRDRSPTFTMQESNRYSSASFANRVMEVEILPEDITNITALMKALRLARIDRETMEAVESFIQHGGDDLYYLRDCMHDIMRTFIFQASRRLLLSHLLKTFNSAVDENAKIEGGDVDPTRRRRLENLKAAVQHADEEVKLLEFWSDIKDMAEKGETKGAVDESQGWGSSWAGLDDSGPKSVISDRKLPGMKECSDSEENSTAVSHDDKLDEGKGKGKAKE